MRVEGGDAADDAVTRLREALARTPFRSEPCRSVRVGSRTFRRGADRLGLARDHALGRRRGQPARAWAHRSVLAGADGAALVHRRRATHLGRPRAAGRRRCISRARRRRSSTSSRARASRSRATATRKRRSPVGPATASSISRSSTRTRSAPATTASSSSRSGSDTTPPTRCSRGRRVLARPDLGAPGSTRGSPVGARGRRRAADLGRARGAAARIVNLADVDGRRAGATVGTSSRRPRWAGGLGADRACPLRRSAREADEPSARSLGGGGDLRRPRGRAARCCSIRARAPAGEIEEFPVRERVHDRTAGRHAACARHPGRR